MKFQNPLNSSTRIGLGILALLALQLGGCGGGVSSTPPASAPTTNISGTMIGLTGSVVLQTNGANDLTVSDNGPFTISPAITPVVTQDVAVSVQPAGQRCSVANGNGTAAPSGTDVVVICSPSGPFSFSYTGSDQFFTVPYGVTSIHVDMWGGGGGGGGKLESRDRPGLGGGGSFSSADIAVTPGETLTIQVGGGGGPGIDGSLTPIPVLGTPTTLLGGLGGWPRGGNGGAMVSAGWLGASGAGGGGFSAIQRLLPAGTMYCGGIGGGGGGGGMGGGAMPGGPENCVGGVLLLAGGGGGAGGATYNSTSLGVPHGGAAGIFGIPGAGEASPANGGAGGTSTAGGAAGVGAVNGQAGASLIGGAAQAGFGNGRPAGGGGGSGYFGGGSGSSGSSSYDSGGGGGGSSFGPSLAVVISGLGPLPGNSTNPNNGGAGFGGQHASAGTNGKVRISYSGLPAPTVPVPPPVVINNDDYVWKVQSFSFPKDELSCVGKQLVQFNSRYKTYVGLTLCNDKNEFRAYMSSDNVAFLPITDTNGHGQDHCELVNKNFQLPISDDITSGNCATCSTSRNLPLEFVDTWSRADIRTPFSLVHSGTWAKLQDCNAV
jgi:hypothetical protein